MVMFMVIIVLFGIEQVETSNVGRIKDKNDFTITQKHTIVQKMADLQTSLSLTLKEMDGMRVEN